MTTTDQLLREEFEKAYRFYSDSKSEIEGINLEIKDVVKVLAAKLEKKPATLLKTFAYKYKLAKKGEDDLADIQQILVEMEDK